MEGDLYRMEASWKISEIPEKELKEYRKQGIDDLIARIAINRGLSVKDFKRITEEKLWGHICDYCDEIVGINAAAKKIIRAIIDRNTRIRIFSDYDTDGITSAAIANSMFNAFYVYFKKDSEAVIQDKIEITIPSRKIGYGINMDYCDKVIEEKKKNPDINYLVVTFDNGITAVEQIKYLQDNGIDTVVTDHHEPNGINIPVGIVVDPKKDESDIGKELCGAGVAFLLGCQMVRVIYDIPGINKSKLGAFFSHYINKSLQFAAIGTIGDVMPLTVFNLHLVASGIKTINSSKNGTPIKRLMDCLGLESITSKDIGFGLAAAINACGQMEEEMTAYTLLSSSDEDDNNDSKAEEVFGLYEMSKNTTKKNKDKIKEDLDSGIFDKDLFCIYVIKDIKHGIAGKLANFISDYTGKPAIVLVDTGENELKGSGRCVADMDMLAPLKSAEKSGLIKSANGHKQACGVIFYKDKLNETKKSLNSFLEERISLGEISLSDKHEILIDKIISVDDINMENYRKINMLPYSNGFEQPRLFLGGYVLNAKRSKNNPNNVCYTIGDIKTDSRIDIWVWNKKPNEYDPKKHKNIGIVGNIVRNFMRRNQLTMDVEDIKFS